MRYVTRHRRNVATDLPGYRINYLPFVVIDTDEKKVVSSHMSQLAASEQSQALNNKGTQS